MTMLRALEVGNEGEGERVRGKDEEVREKKVEGGMTYSNSRQRSIFMGLLSFHKPLEHSTRTRQIEVQKSEPWNHALRIDFLDLSKFYLMDFWGASRRSSGQSDFKLWDTHEQRRKDK